MLLVYERVKYFARVTGRLCIENLVLWVAITVMLTLHYTLHLLD